MLGNSKRDKPMTTESKDIIYTNIIVTNDKNNITRCSTLSQRNQPILTNAREWKMAVVRFDVNTGIPMLEASPTQTIGMKYGIFSFNNRINTLYGTDFFGEPSEVIRALNYTLSLAYASLLPNLPVICQYPPVFGLKDDKITLYFPASYIANNVQIFISRDGYNDMTPAVPIDSNIFPAGFDTEIYANPNGEDIFFDLKNQSYLAPVAPRVGYPTQISNIGVDYYYLESINASLDNLNSINKIELYTANLPIRAELDNISTGVSSQSSAKISDFVVTNSSPYANRVLLEYLPMAQYRWIELVGSGEVKDIQLEVFYVTKFGTSKPLYLIPGTHMNIKICFQRTI